MNKLSIMLVTLKITGAEEFDAIKSIGKFVHYLMHPALIFKGLWEYTVIYSFWICLFVAMIAAIFYALGFKKCAKYVPGSMALYTLIRMLGSAF